MKKYQEELGELLTDKMFFYRESDRDMTYKDRRFTPMIRGLHKTPLGQDLRPLVKECLDDYLNDRGPDVQFWFMTTDEDSIYFPFFVHEGIQAYMIRMRCVNPE